MTSYTLRALTAALFLLAVPAVSQAQTYNCKAEVVATGNGAVTENGAKEKAIKQWRNQVVTNLGIFYGDFALANDGKGGVVERCARSLLGLMVCQARGRPCLVPSGVTELECRKSDSPSCDPTVKWVQSRLNTKGFDISVDGSAGPATERAIRAYRKKNGLGDGSEIDEKLIDSLKS